MYFSLEGTSSDCWQALGDLREVENAEFHTLDVPDAAQHNNELLDLVTSGTPVATLGLIALKLGPHAINAVRDIFIKYLEGRKVKLKIKDGKEEISYEGPLTPPQQQQLEEQIQQISRQLKP